MPLLQALTFNEVEISLVWPYAAISTVIHTITQLSPTEAILATRADWSIRAGEVIVAEILPNLVPGLGIANMEEAK